MKYLDLSTNRRVENLMTDVFEAISTLEKSELKISELMETQSIFELVFEIVKDTGFYNHDENFNLIKALNVDTNDHDTENALYTTWTAMGINLNTSKTQQEFNAKFALFVPIILKNMGAVNAIAV
ncbi:hypothetical protein [Psychroserpens sp. NJDZ02]|uniref:hypothetical protein n=1 Tax=Psychroserpens sp. NJDZ02 TaxID=2570561 RepID=UPI001F117811|nr:hypothetical protein [Psychroserpens sp. NJDZ02]